MFQVQHAKKPAKIHAFMELRSQWEKEIINEQVLKQTIYTQKVIEVLKEIRTSKCCWKGILF